ncbi:MAG: ATP-binding cassette domain-containing protein [Actinomycetaceae bacterium]|nr:ATP-binding cassette domain-containing protein [Actinomycetaceae bacterium]
MDAKPSEARQSGDLALSLRSISQGYGKRAVLHEVSFDVPRRQTIGLLGPNGAGKTTLLRTLTTLMKPRSGEIIAEGRWIDSRQATRDFRRQLGYLPQGFSYDSSFTAHEFVSYALWMRKVPNADIAAEASKALEQVGLAERANSKMGELSGGMRQRAGIAAAIAAEPALVVLDEPTAGLDPGQRFELRALLGDVAKRSTIILSTHLIEDLAAIADYLVVISDGNIIYQGSTAMLHDAKYQSVEGLEAAYRDLLAGKWS